MYAFGARLGVLATLIGVVSGMLGMGFLLWYFGLLREAGAEPRVAQAAAAPLAQPTVLPDAAAADTVAGVPDYARWGSAEAPVKIVVFADPKCPYCKQSATDNELRLIREFVENGRASLIYRHFAFLGPDSSALATALDCAGRQGAFWTMHALVFGDDERSIASLARGELTDDVVAALRAGSLDRAAFEACVKGGEARARVEADTAAGRSLGVLGTPTIFVNGRRVIGAVPYDMLQSTVEFALNERR